VFLLLGVVYQGKDMADNELRPFRGGLIDISVAEPVEPQHFAGAGARPNKIRLRPREPGMQIPKKCYKNPKFFIQKHKVEFKNHNFVAIYFKEPFDDHFYLKKHEIFLKHENRRILRGKWSELEPEFLTSRSRSHTKMDRLRNTDRHYIYCSRPLKRQFYYCIDRVPAWAASKRR
jgi:hypothetical protein